MEVIRVTFSCACAGIAKIWNALIANKRAAVLSYFIPPQCLSHRKHVAFQSRSECKTHGTPDAPGGRCLIERHLNEAEERRDKHSG